MIKFRAYLLILCSIVLLSACSDKPAWVSEPTVINITYKTEGGQSTLIKYEVAITPVGEGQLAWKINDSKLIQLQGNRNLDALNKAFHSLLPDVTTDHSGTVIGEYSYSRLINDLAKRNGFSEKDRSDMEMVIAIPGENYLRNARMNRLVQTLLLSTSPYYPEDGDESVLFKDYVIGDLATTTGVRTSVSKINDQTYRIKQVEIFNEERYGKFLEKQLQEATQGEGGGVISDANRKYVLDVRFDSKDYFPTTGSWLTKTSYKRDGELIETVYKESFSVTRK